MSEPKPTDPENDREDAARLCTRSDPLRPNISLPERSVGSKPTAESLLAEYHALARRVDDMAAAQEAHTRRLGDLAALARRGDGEEAQRRLGQMDRALRVWDFGETVRDLRVLRRKSAKFLGEK